MDAAGLQGFCDLAGRNVGDVNSRKAVDLAAISADVSDLAHDKSRAREHIGRLLHQTALGGNGEGQLGHSALPSVAPSKRSE